MKWLLLLSLFSFSACYSVHEQEEAFQYEQWKKEKKLEEKEKAEQYLEDISK